MLSGFFLLITISFLILFLKAFNSKKLSIILIGITLIHFSLGYFGVYENTASTPPFLFRGILSSILLIIIFLKSRFGKTLINNVHLPTIHLMHSLRILVEIVLFLLFQEGLINVSQTFEGWNFDILIGLSATLIYYFGFIKSKISPKLLIAWNILGMIVLTGVVISSALALPGAMQQYAFDQPNIAMTYFPFNLLPCVVVPLVYLSHIVSIKKLCKSVQP